MFRGGVIGTGFFAQNQLHGWQEVDGAEIVAVCDLDESKARAAADTFGVAQVFTDAETMLQTADLDFVDIITTVNSHRPLVELAAKYGKHTICQKPFALDMDDGRAMVQACADAGVQLMVHENFRWQRPLRAVKDHLGDVGDLFFGRVYWRSGYDVYENQPYLAEDERFIIYDLGIHLLDLARFYLGDVDDIMCTTQRVNPNIKGEDVATILLKMTSGATCVVDCSYASRMAEEIFPRTSVHLEGANGSVTLDHRHQLVHTVGQDATTETVPPLEYTWSTPPAEPIQDSVVAIQRHWVDVLRGETEPETSGADNLKTLELVFGAYESAKTGLPYKVGTL